MRSRPVIRICLAAVVCVWAGAASFAFAGEAPGGNVQLAVADDSEGLMARLREVWRHMGFGPREGTQAAQVEPVEQQKVSMLTPEQREQMRDQIRQQWQSATPEERQRRREEFRERWESSKPEERERFRARARERWERGEDNGRGGPGGPPGGPGGGFGPPGGPPGR